MRKCLSLLLFITEASPFTHPTVLQCTPSILNMQTDEGISTAMQSTPLTDKGISTALQSIPSFLKISQISQTKGRGVLALSPIPMHTDVGDYIGEHITGKQKDCRYLPSQFSYRTKQDLVWAKSRQDCKQTTTGHYLFGVSSLDLFIDAEDEQKSNWTRFLNHDDHAPNLRVKCLPSGVGGKPRVWFVASRDISPGEELTFSYGEDYWFEGDLVDYVGQNIPRDNLFFSLN